jgi:hypothetical protein
MARGGPREGAGRPVGARNKLDKEAAEIAASEGIMPKDFLLGLVRDEGQPLDVRIEAAKAAAPYYHAKLAAIEHSGAIGLRHEDALDELE